MTNKVFYQAAAAEVADGALDEALWTKVTVELVGADPVARQAKYIQLRAQEMALETKKNAALNIWRRIPWWVKWPAIAIAVFIALAAM